MRYVLLHIFPFSLFTVLGSSYLFYLFFLVLVLYSLDFCCSIFSWFGIEGRNKCSCWSVAVCPMAYTCLLLYLNHKLWKVKCKIWLWSQVITLLKLSCLEPTCSYKYKENVYIEFNAQTCQFDVQQLYNKELSDPRGILHLHNFLA